MTAPPGLVERVMQRIEEPNRAAWYQQPWQDWPAGFRATALAMLVAVFCGICLLIWELPYVAQLSPAAKQFAAWLSPADALWLTSKIVATTLFSAVSSLGTGVLLCWAVAAGVGYALCIGLGTAVFKFAVARR